MRAIYYLSVFILFVACQQADSQKIDVEKLKELRSHGVAVVDIRTLNEYEGGHIPNVKHINFRDNDFLIRMEELGKDNPIIIHCASGGRSGAASRMLREAGFKQVYDYTGGFVDWKKRGEKIEK